MRKPVIPQLSVNKKIYEEYGPWQVDEWSNNRIVLQSHSTDDVALEITGNFGCKEDKYEYAVQLAARMNIGLRLIPPGFLSLNYENKT